MKNFNASYFSLFVLSLLAPLHFSQAQDLRACDLRYQESDLSIPQRQVSKLEEASNCLRSLSIRSDATLDRMMIIASSAILSRPANERSWINQMKTDLDAHQGRVTNNGILSYWAAVHSSFDSALKDRPLGKMKLNTFQNLGYLVTQLETAINQAGNTHVYGPYRVYAIYQTEILPESNPLLTNRKNKSLAIARAKHAYDNGKKLSSNYIAYAKLLDLDSSNRSLVVQILRELLALEATASRDLNPYEEAERYPSVETRGDIATAKAMLIRLGEKL